MMAAAHILTGAVVTKALIAPTNLQLGVAILGALTADIDNPRSVLGKIFFFISLPLALIGHRTITHSLVGAGLFALLIQLIQIKTGIPILVPWLIGYFSHIILDSFTKEGVPLFYPYPKYFGFGLITSGGIAEIIYTVVLTVLVISKGGFQPF